MTINNRAACLTAFACLALFGRGGLPAQAEEDAVKLDEIVVTAQKREENLQDVGISETAFSARQLSQMGMVSTTDLTNQVPNFRFVQSNPGTVNLNIRGVSQNDFADHLEGPIAVYLDDSYQGLSTAIGGQMFDLERVEVLRGPQGTLFGRNATGGLVQYISKQPSADFEAYAQATLGRFNEKILEAAVGGSVSDAIRVRFSMASNYNDAWGISSVGGPDTGVVDNWSMRFQAVADLNSATQLHFTVRGGGNGREDEGVTGTIPAYSPAGFQGLGQYLPATVNAYGTCPGCNLFGNTGNHYDRSDGTAGTAGRVLRDNVGATLKLNSDLGAVQLTAITDGMYIRKELNNFDTDNNVEPLFNYTAQTKYHQWSQEVRLSGEAGALKWIGGLYYLNMDGHYHVQVDFDPSFTAGLPDGTLATSSKNFYQITTKSWSAFSQGDYAVTDTVNATLGVRFTSDKKQDDFVWFGNYPGAGPAFSFVYNPSTDASAERTFNMVSAKAALDWHFAPDKLLYASVSRGVKGGNWESPIFPGPTPTVALALPHNPETLYDYEIGVKSMWLQDRLRFNAGVFYYDYKNYQAFGLVNLVQSIENDDATEVGSEMELTYLPVNGLSLSLGLAALDSKVKNHTLPDGVTKANVQLPLAPKFSGNAAARYEHPLLGGIGAVGSNFNYTGHQYFDVNNGPLTAQAGHGLTDLRTSWETADHRWEMALWVKNVTNKTYTVFQQDIAALSLGNYLLAPPRWYGVTLRVSY